MPKMHYETLRTASGKSGEQPLMLTFGKLGTFGNSAPDEHSNGRQIT